MTGYVSQTYNIYLIVGLTLLKLVCGKGDTKACGLTLSIFYLPIKCMVVTIGTKFSQFQSIGCIVLIFLSHTSRNTRWFDINTIRTQLVHSKTILTQTSLPLAMNLLCVFDSPNISIFRPEINKKHGEKILTWNE